nr:MAG TPA: transcription factor IIS-like protein [Bacteriophage sp.]
MANINCTCGNCGSKDLRVRTSERVGLRTGSALLICNSCGARNYLMWEQVRLETPTFHERSEYLGAVRPLLQMDERQIEIPTD